MSYKLFLDDIRIPQDTTFVIVRNYCDFVEKVKKYGVPEEVSFDHDLADVHYAMQEKTDFITWAEYYNSQDREMTGYDCAKWLLEYCQENGLALPKKISVHSMNSVGKQNILNLFK